MVVAIEEDAVAMAQGGKKSKTSTSSPRGSPRSLLPIPR